MSGSELTDGVGVTRRRVVQQAIGGGALLGGLPAVLAACGGSSSNVASQGVAGADSLPAGSGEIAHLTFGYADGPRSLDPAFGLNSGSNLYNMCLGFEALMTYDEALHLTPSLAASWHTPDPSTYVYRLRDGLTFTDGSPVTPEDVKFSFERHTDQRLASSFIAYLTRLKRVEITGPREVTIRLTQPDVTFRYIPTFIVIVKKAQVEQLGKDYGTPKGIPVGTGPYEFTSFTIDQTVKSKRFERYWGKKPQVKAITWQTIADQSAQMLAIGAGDIDGVFDVSNDIPSWERISTVRFHEAPPSSTTWISLAAQKPPWNDVHVRRAFAYSVDRAGIARAIDNGLGTPAKSLIPPLQWRGVLDGPETDRFIAGLPSYSFDLDKAKQELAKSSVPKGFSFQAAAPSSSPELVKMMEVIAQALGQIGVNLSVKELSGQAYSGLGTNPAYPTRIVSFLFDYPDPIEVFNKFTTKGAATDIAHFTTPELNRLFNEQAASTDASVRARDIEQMARIAQDQVPFVPITWEGNGLALRKDLVFRSFNPYTGLVGCWASEIAPRA
jgi:peptide/nickel transport system substrate-binding protein